MEKRRERAMTGVTSLMPGTFGNEPSKSSCVIDLTEETYKMTKTTVPPPPPPPPPRRGLVTRAPRRRVAFVSGMVDAAGAGGGGGGGDAVVVNVRRGDMAKTALRARGNMARPPLRPLHADRLDVEEDFTYITGPRYFFQRFARQYTEAALVVWVLLFLLELSMIVLYIVQSAVDDGMSWDRYAASEYSGWFYAFFALSVISLVQLFFAYSLSITTILVVVSTSIYQIVLFFVALAPRRRWVSRMYVPFFLRVWPMRQYLLFVLDSIALIWPRHHRLDLVRLVAVPLTLFVCLVFTAAGCFRIDQVFQGHPMNVGVSLYFLVTTVSTVGFGDVTPQTQSGKAIVIVIILLFIARMPTFIQAIRSAAKIFRAYRAYEGRRKHFIVYGRVTRDEAVSILDEVFRLYPMKSVCFCNKEFAPDVCAIRRHSTYRLRTTFLVADSVDASTLHRLKAAEASAVVIVPFEEGHSARVDDNVMFTSVVFERLQPSLPQYVWLRYGLHTKLLHGHRAVVIDEHMKKNILSCALLLPGVIPFLVNLVRTAGVPKRDAHDAPAHAGMSDWRRAYGHSRRQVISSCPVPACFAHVPLRDVVHAFHEHHVLVVAVEEEARQVMRLDLDYAVELDDILVVVYEGYCNRLRRALSAFATHHHHHHHHQNNNDDDNQQPPHTSAPWHHDSSTSSEHNKMYTCHDGGGVADASAQTMHRVTADDFPGSNMNVFRSDPMYRSAAAVAKAAMTPSPTSNVRTTLADDVTHIAADAGVHGRLGGGGGSSNGNSRSDNNDKKKKDNTDDGDDGGGSNSSNSNNNGGGSGGVVTRASVTSDAANPVSTLTRRAHETFLFVDQTASILRKFDTPLYDDVISQTIAQYHLYVMMQTIRAVHPDTRLTVLTLRQYPEAFLQAWVNIFGTPLYYVRGQGSLDSHLNYALAADAAVDEVRGVLLYCSQMGPRDFGDVPILSVENNIRELLKWRHTRRTATRATDTAAAPATMSAQRGTHGSTRLDDREQTIVVELQSFTSAVQIPPFHRDTAWRQHGAASFQNCLAFMMGKCFSSNMLLPLIVHSHRDFHIARFFEMVLNLFAAPEMFDMSEWTYRVRERQTLFCFWVCSHDGVAAYGDVFDLLLRTRACLCIGVFRRFPDGYAEGNPRYFVTNPPRGMGIVADDIIYCLDGGAHHTKS